FLSDPPSLLSTLLYVLKVRDEDYEIPPITPPNHADPSLLHLMEHESGYPFHSLPHNGLLNTYSYPELPALMMSNMLGQDTHLLSGPMHSVSTSPFLNLSPFSCGPFAIARVKRCSRLLVFAVRGLEVGQRVSAENIVSEGFTCSCYRKFWVVFLFYFQSYDTALELKYTAAKR
uniref:Uncharacterized protein n=1 Tax=Acanthochromis polyacanthus TaxID=80966 RepID=A0A3Q1FAF0_9TELE